MHLAPGLVCSNRPEGHLLSGFDPSATQTVPTVCIRGSGMAVQGPPPRALPFSSCLYEGRRGRPYPRYAKWASGSVSTIGLSWPQSREQLCTTGTRVASASQPVRASGQLRKEQALPCAENLFSWCGVRLCEYDCMPQRAQAVLNCLSSFRGRNVGTTETVFRGSCGIWHP